MKLSLGSIFKVSIRYVYPRGNTYYYQRKIPLDLLDRYGGTQLIKVNLKTDDLKQVAKQVCALNKQYESIWASLRINLNLKPLSVREAAIKLLAKHELKPRPTINEELGIDRFIDSLQGKREAYAQGDDDVYWNADLEEYLDPVEVEAVRLINEEPKFRLSDALILYLSGHAKKNDEKFEIYVQRVWNKLVGLIGDKEFEHVTRADANEFASRGLAGDSKTTTVDRQIGVIRAVFNVVIAEKELAKSNPFHKLRIAGLGEDSKVRGIFDTSQLSMGFPRFHGHIVKHVVDFQIVLG